MLNVLLMAAAAVAVAYGSASRAGWHSKREIETVAELKEIYFRHRDWLVGEDGGIFVLPRAAPGGG